MPQGPSTLQIGYAFPTSVVDRDTFPTRPVSEGGHEKFRKAAEEGKGKSTLLAPHEHKIKKTKRTPKTPVIVPDQDDESSPSPTPPSSVHNSDEDDQHEAQSVHDQDEPAANDLDPTHDAGNPAGDVPSLGDDADPHAPISRPQKGKSKETAAEAAQRELDDIEDARNIQKQFDDVGGDGDDEDGEDDEDDDEDGAPDSDPERVKAAQEKASIKLARRIQDEFARDMDIDLSAHDLNLEGAVPTLSHHSNRSSPLTASPSIPADLHDGMPPPAAPEPLTEAERLKKRRSASAHKGALTKAKNKAEQAALAAAGEAPPVPTAPKPAVRVYQSLSKSAPKAQLKPAGKAAPTGPKAKAETLKRPRTASASSAAGPSAPKSKPFRPPPKKRAKVISTSSDEGKKSTGSTEMHPTFGPMNKGSG